MNDRSGAKQSGLLSSVVMVALALALAGCGGGGDDSESSAAPVTSAPAPDPVAPAEPVTPPDSGVPSEPVEPSDPVPQPEPTPAPTPLPIVVLPPPAPTPVPSPAPGPDPAPIEPAPAPEPAPNPNPEPAPEPDPNPEPIEPAPEPEPPVSNTAPTIQGTAIEVVEVNSTYTFLPAASDADGDELMFQIENKPAWATFSTLTGKLSGTPTLADEGTYADIRISTSDGEAHASLPPFSITVVAPTVTSASLSWNAPVQNHDGSALTDLAGFTIVYGPSQTMLYQTVRIDNPSIDRYVLDDLPAGTYYFAVKAYNSVGVESEMSNIVSKTIR